MMVAHGWEEIAGAVETWIESALARTDARQEGVSA
jgi:hypothetical protein